MNERAMQLRKETFFLSVLSGLIAGTGLAQDTVRYTGATLANVDYHHGQLAPAVGVHSYQTFRANRSYPSPEKGWTYNHAPMLAYWNNTFFISYLSNPVGEHIPPGQSLLQTSPDGIHWSEPEVVFPPYPIPDGTAKEGRPGVAANLDAVMHQRMAFHVASSGRLLVLGYYGFALDDKDHPNDGKGIGRVVREVYKDGSKGPIYFIRKNKSWKQPLRHPEFEESSDAGFVAACKELLSSPLRMQEWVEEADRDDPLIPLKKQYKAFSYYHLPDNRVVGLWKNALTSLSTDGGKTWEYAPLRAPGFVNANAKIWGQQTSDNRYATVYNPSEFRWPLAVSVSDDGLQYTNLLLVNGEITAMRYGGNYKSYGPQYVRGIIAGNGAPPDGNLWVTYSMNKEDIWVSSIPIPVTDRVEEHVSDNFSALPDGRELRYWNLYSPLWAPVAIRRSPDDSKALSLRDSDPFDYAKAERVLPATRRLLARFSITPQQQDTGLLDIEFQDGKGTPGIRISFDSLGNLRVKAGYRYKNLLKYQAGVPYDIQVQLDTRTRLYTVSVNGKETGTQVLFAPLAHISRVVFRTGAVRRFPDADTPTDQSYDLPGAEAKAPEAAFLIGSLTTSDW